jgi:hypothetical protein
MLLIDTRLPPPDPPSVRRPWEPNWRLWAWVALTIGTGVAAKSTAGLLGYAFVLACLVCACRAICVVLPPLDGLRDYRQ